MVIDNRQYAIHCMRNKNIKVKDSKPTCSKLSTPLD